MSFYSVKNANSNSCPGSMNGNAMNGLCQKLCVQLKNVYDECISQKQLDDKEIHVGNIVPVLPSGCGCGCGGNSGCSGGCSGNTYSANCRCECHGNHCHCKCGSCSDGVSHQDAVENLENNSDSCRPQPVPPQPCGAWTFESCRSSTTKGEISNLCIDRLCDRPQYARVKCTVDVPIDVMFTDQNCQEWIGQAVVQVDKDVILCIPEESIVPFTLESLVSAICVSGEWIGGCGFEITICMTIVLKVLAEVEVMIPAYGFCQVPPAEEFAENVCDEFFSLPLFPQSTGCMQDAEVICPTKTETDVNTGCGCNCNSGCRRACSRCGTVCAGSGSTCPRCGGAMSRA